MSHNKKIALITAAICGGVGIVIVFAACLLIQFDFTRINTMKFEEKTYEVSESFHNIDINDIECDVMLVPVENGPSRVVCYENEDIVNTISVQGDTLTVTRKDQRPWYKHFGIWWAQNNTVTIYLAEKEYESLSIKTVSGEISVADSFRFSEAKLQSTSGDITFASRVQGDLFVKTTSGDITLREIEPKMAEVRSTSGDLSLTEISAAELMLKTTSGSIKTEAVTATGHAEFISVSGDIRLRGADADSFFIKTTSGDVKGTLFSDKYFITHTTSGSVHTPLSKEGAGECKIQTTSGDIRIDIDA
ncbi:MAG: DUF4097 domain-containing protein [Clostridiales bacterium]|nr:DUF4097 domain-containing protein [Clostridiales bacterium]